jgi:hypothetical protein
VLITSLPVNYKGESLKKLKIIAAFLSITFPLVGYWVYRSLIRIGPFYLAYDPEIQYMINSLLPFKGYAYTYIDHPGTPVEVIGSALLLGTYPFFKNNFILSHLQNPEIFFMEAHIFWLSGNFRDKAIYGGHGANKP